MKIKIVTCDETVKDPRSILVALGCLNFDDGITHKTNVAKLYVDAIARAIKTDQTVTLYARCGMVPNMIGHLISQGIIKNTEATISLYSSTGVLSCGYDGDGYLDKTWRYGVLEENAYDYIEEMKSNLMGRTE